MGRSAEPVRGWSPVEARRSADVRVKIPLDKPTTLGEMVKRLADENPLLRDQIVRGDGTPRSSTRILINGEPPRDLHARVEMRREAARDVIVVVLSDGTVIVITDIVIIVFLPCDG